VPPLRPGAMSDAAPHDIDAMCYACSRREVFDWPTFSPLLSAWHGARLHSIDRSEPHYGRDRSHQLSDSDVASDKHHAVSGGTNMGSRP